MTAKLTLELPDEACVIEVEAGSDMAHMLHAAFLSIKALSCVPELIPQHAKAMARVDEEMLNHIKRLQRGNYDRLDDNYLRR